MAIIQHVYDSYSQAQRVMEALQAAGVQSEKVSLVMSEGAGGAQAVPTGSFVTGDGHDHGADPLGSFVAGASPDQGAAHPGSFADTDGVHAHDERVGSFASVDRDTVTSFVGGEQRATVSSHGNIVRMLLEAGLDQAAAEAQLSAIHEGKALLLVQVMPDDAARVNAILAMA